MPWAARFSEPAQITSSALRERSDRPCSPSAQRRASARLDLPEPFGPDDRADAGAELDVRPLGERLEALEAQGEEPRRARPSDRSCRRVAGAADPCRSGSAVHRDRALGRRARPGCARAPGPRRGLGAPARRPLADAEDLAVDPDLDPELLLVVGPGRLEQPVLGPLAGRRWVYSCSRLLGLLSDSTGASSDELGLGQLDGASRGPARSRGRGRARRPAPRTTRRGATGDAGRCAAPRPRRGAGTARGRAGRRAGRGRRSRRSPRGARTGRPRRRRGGGRTAPRRWRGSRPRRRGTRAARCGRARRRGARGASCCGRAPARAGRGRGPGARGARRRPVRVAPRTRPTAG